MENHQCSGSIKLGDMQIRFDGPKEFVEEMVKRFTESSQWAGVDAGAFSTGPQPGSGPCNQLRSLVSSKQPHGHQEIIAVLAFGLGESGVSPFGEQDVRRAYIEAGVRPPKVVSQAIRDAKNKYKYLQTAGKRGRYRLSEHGDTLVRFDLPRPGGN